MEKKDIFGTFGKWFILCLYFAWIISAMTSLGAFVGLLINIAINKDELILAVIISASAVGFVVGILAAEHRRRSDFL
ncbi:hypothetical protein [Kangiella sp.]|uniref:hypothetical protein n=1 Tax=Kangiella sp. TaxID=1920245 RepID=UPI003A8DB936